MAAEYDELQALYQYLAFDKKTDMTPVELRADWLGLRREKAMLSTGPDGWGPFLRKSEAEAGNEAVSLLGDDLAGVIAFRRRVAQRIKDDELKGRLTLNRCPKCRRIPRTPNARQCLWCGHDWHDVAWLGEYHS